MNSAPAVLRIPAIDMESVTCTSTQAVDHNESYPWAAYTPEPSPRSPHAEPNVDQCLIPMQPALSPELLQTVCAPYFEQMCRSIKMDPFVQKMPADSISPGMLQPMCEPFFEDMLTALHQTLQMQGQQQPFNSCFQPVFYPQAGFYHTDTESTAASLRYPSSDSEDIVETKSEDTSDVERSVMVCRHWKSKGWCRMESKCKFLHPDHKCGISAPRPALAPGASAEGEAEAGRRKKKGSKNRSSRWEEEQLSTEQ